MHAFLAVYIGFLDIIKHYKWSFSVQISIALFLDNKCKWIEINFLMIIFLLVENQRLKVILIIYGILFLSLCMSTDRNPLSLWDQEKPPKCIHRTIRTTGLLRQGVKSDYLCLLYMCLSRCMNWWTDVNTGELHRKNKSLNFHFWIKKKLYSRVQGD